LRALAQYPSACAKEAIRIARARSSAPSGEFAPAADPQSTERGSLLLPSLLPGGSTCSEAAPRAVGNLAMSHAPIAEVICCQRFVEATRHCQGSARLAKWPCSPRSGQGSTPNFHGAAKRRRREQPCRGKVIPPCRSLPGSARRC
jgi:hypothetical protein